MPFRLANEPESFFTKNFATYTSVINYTVYNESPFFEENDILFVLVRKGSGQLTANTLTYNIKENHLCMIQQSSVFMFKNQDSIPLSLEVIVSSNALISLFDTQPAASDYTYSISQTPVGIRLSGKLGDKIVQYFDELKSKKLLTPYLKICLVEKITYMAFRLFTHPELIILPNEGPKTPLCKTLFEYIQANCAENLTSSQVAKKFHISKQQLNIQLYSICGANFYHVLAKARVKFCCCLFLRDMSLSEVAIHSGFSSDAVFFKTFKEIKGCTPDQWRNEMRLALSKKDEKPVNSKLVEISCYLYENFRKDINCKSCATTLYMSTKEVEKITKAFYGISFSQSLTNLRLAYAESLLAVSSLNINDIAFDAGFNSVHTFIRLFKKKNAMTPGEYKKETVKKYEKRNI